MNQSSARTLVVFSVVLVLIGFSVMSPGGGLAAMAVAVLSAAGAAAVGTGRVRIVGVVLVVLSGAFAASFWPGFKKERERMARRAASPAVERAAVPGE